MQRVYEEQKGIYSYRRITIYLNHFLNAQVNHKCVHRLMEASFFMLLIHSTS
ncbi:IS3 family transposase [Paucisalibacillus globulus]|uniref:IS3 family transposase n=1 Tax=Paucisalibacillus globulus TaxID=351095 RepID=UPI0009FC0FCB